MKQSFGVEVKGLESITQPTISEVAYAATEVNVHSIWTHPTLEAETLLCPMMPTEFVARLAKMSDSHMTRSGAKSCLQLESCGNPVLWAWRRCSPTSFKLNRRTTVRVFKSRDSRKTLLQSPGAQAVIDASARAPDSG